MFDSVPWYLNANVIGISWQMSGYSFKTIPFNGAMENRQRTQKYNMAEPKRFVCDIIHLDLFDLVLDFLSFKWGFQGH